MHIFALFRVSVWFSSDRLRITMTSSNGNIFRVTGPLCGSPMYSLHKGQWHGALMFSLICAWNSWVNNREAGDLRRHRAHYDVIEMMTPLPLGQAYDWPNASEITLKKQVTGPHICGTVTCFFRVDSLAFGQSYASMYIRKTWLKHYENKHNKTMCIFLGYAVYCLQKKTLRSNNVNYANGASKCKLYGQNCWHYWLHPA